MKTIRVAGKNYAVVAFKPEEVLRFVSVKKGERITAQRVAIFEDAKTLVGNGFAFCSSKDEYDPKVGLGLALGRALASIKVEVVSPHVSKPFTRRLTAAEKAPFYKLVLGVSSEPNKKRKVAPKARVVSADGD